MVCVLSVMNGFGTLIEGMFSQFDPELRIIATEGKSFSVDNESIQEVLSLPSVAAVSQIVEETALISYKGHQMPAHIVGVDNQFAAITRIDSIITDGYFSVFDGAFERAVLGRGLAGQIGINAHFVGGLHIYAPKRNGRVNMLRPDESFNEATAFIAGTFAVNQVQYDESYMLVSLPFSFFSASFVCDNPQPARNTVADAKNMLERILLIFCFVLFYFFKRQNYNFFCLLPRNMITNLRLPPII